MRGVRATAAATRRGIYAPKNRLGKTNFICVTLMSLSYSGEMTARISDSESKTESLVGSLILKLLTPG